MAHRITGLIGQAEQFWFFLLNKGKFLVKIYLDYIFYCYQYFFKFTKHNYRFYKTPDSYLYISFA